MVYSGECLPRKWFILGNGYLANGFLVDVMHYLRFIPKFSEKVGSESFPTLIVPGVVMPNFKGFFSTIPPNNCSKTIIHGLFMELF